MRTLDRTFVQVFNTYSGTMDRIHNFMMDYMKNDGRIVRKEADGRIVILKMRSAKINDRMQDILYQA